MSLGPGIPNHVPDFRQAALKYNLGNPKELRTTKNSAKLSRLVKPHPHEQFGLPPGPGVGCGPVHFKERDLVFEIGTKYRSGVPVDKLDEVIHETWDVFSLPDNHTRSGTLNYYRERSRRLSPPKYVVHSNYLKRLAQYRFLMEPM